MTKYYWIDIERKELEELIWTGDPVQFQCNGKDYFIEGDYFDNDGLGRVGSYMIQNPDIQEDGSRGEHETYYPESGQYKTAKELLQARFLDGKTILEQFDNHNLKYFEN